MVRVRHDAYCAFFRAGPRAHFRCSLVFSIVEHHSVHANAEHAPCFVVSYAEYFICRMRCMHVGKQNSTGFLTRRLTSPSNSACAHNVSVYYPLTQTDAHRRQKGPRSERGSPRRGLPKSAVPFRRISQFRRICSGRYPKTYTCTKQHAVRRLPSAVHLPPCTSSRIHNGFQTNLPNSLISLRLIWTQRAHTCLAIF